MISHVIICTRYASMNFTINSTTTASSSQHTHRVLLLACSLLQENKQTRRKGEEEEEEAVSIRKSSISHFDVRTYYTGQHITLLLLPPTAAVVVVGVAIRIQNNNTCVV